MPYREIVFAQGDDAIEPLKILDNQGKKAAVEYLLQWDQGEGEVRPRSSAGTGDYQERVGKYMLTYNWSLGYIGLEEVIAR